MMRTFTEAVVTIGASTELLVLVKATVALVLGLAAVRIAGSGRASVRHLLLTSTFAVLLALPLASALVPTVRLEIPAAPVSAQPVIPAVIHEQTTQASPESRLNNAALGSNSHSNVLSARTLFLFAWAGGTAIFVASFAAAIWRMRRLRRAGIPWLEGQNTLRTLADKCGVRSPVEVLLHSEVAVPVTCGFFRPAILLPGDAREWSEFDVRRTFVHELEHIQRGDWPVHLMARITCACYWFHPLVWVAWRKLCLEAERACDDAVLLGGERADYAEQLVTMARRLSNALCPPVLSMANRSDLSTRVSAILDSTQRRGRAGVLFASTSLAVATFLVLAIAPVRAVVTASSARYAGTQQNKKVGSALGRALLEAAESGDVDEMAKLLDAGADVNTTVEGDGSALIVASREGNIPAVKLLLERGADVNLAVPGDGNPLIMAAREGLDEIVKLLLDRGANVNQVVPGDENALIQASGAGQLRVAKLLVSQGADVNARVWVSREDIGREGEWRTPLSMARKNGHRVMEEYLLSVGAQ